MNADVLPSYIESAVDLETWNMLVYCGAVAVVRMLGMDVEVEAASRRSRRPRSMPPWELRLTKNIERLRQDIARLEASRGGARSARLQRLVTDLMRRNLTHMQRNEPNTSALLCLESTKQKLTVLTTRLARYRKSRARRIDNKKFEKLAEKLLSQSGQAKR